MQSPSLAFFSIFFFLSKSLAASLNCLWWIVFNPGFSQQVQSNSDTDTLINTEYLFTTKSTFISMHIAPIILSMLIRNNNIIIMIFSLSLFKTKIATKLGSKLYIPFEYWKCVSKDTDILGTPDSHKSCRICSSVRKRRLKEKRMRRTRARVESAEICQDARWPWAVFAQVPIGGRRACCEGIYKYRCRRRR